MLVLLLSSCTEWVPRVRFVAPDRSAEIRVDELGTFDGPIRVCLARDEQKELVLAEERVDWNYVGADAVWAADSLTVAVIACNALLPMRPLIVGYDLQAGLATTAERNLTLLARLIPGGRSPEALTKYCGGETGDGAR